MAINHTPNGHSIEVFKLVSDSLIFERSMVDPSILSPNDLVLIDENRFYFTTDFRNLQCLIIGKRATKNRPFERFFLRY